MRLVVRYVLEFRKLFTSKSVGGYLVHEMLHHSDWNRRSMKCEASGSV